MLPIKNNNIPKDIKKNDILRYLSTFCSSQLLDVLVCDSNKSDNKKPIIVKKIPIINRKIPIHVSR